MEALLQKLDAFFNGFFICDGLVQRLRFITCHFTNKLMRFILLIICLGIITFSCKKDDDKRMHYNHWPVVDIDASQSGNANQIFKVTVHCPYSSGSCDLVDKFEENKQGTLITIKAMGYSRGNICTADAGIKTAVYNFVATAAATYDLRFLNPDSSSIYLQSHFPLGLLQHPTCTNARFV